MTCAVHGDPYHVVIPRPRSALGSRPRCSGCGHQVATPAGPPPESRTLPPWTWPLELLDRWRARRMTVPPAVFYLPDGTWSCTRDGVTEPCGDCDGCRYIASVNRALRRPQQVSDGEPAGHPDRFITWDW